MTRLFSKGFTKEVGKLAFLHYSTNPLTLKLFEDLGEKQSQAESMAQEERVRWPLLLTQGRMKDGTLQHFCV